MGLDNREYTVRLLKGGSGQTHTLVGVSVDRKSGINIPDNTPHNQTHDMGSCDGADCPLYAIIVTPMSTGSARLNSSILLKKQVPFADLLR
jgi:hypothetical protein